MRCCLVHAAWRVVESQELEGLRLFYDPFAGVLASEAAVAAALRQAQPITNQDGSAGGGIGRRYKVSTISTRVWWFDRQIVEALQPPSPSASASDGTPKGAAAAPVPRQVVLLGAGMDTRPWRLDDLPKVIPPPRLFVPLECTLSASASQLVLMLSAGNHWAPLPACLPA